MQDKKILIIDDEADFASLSFRKEKEKESEEVNEENMQVESKEKELEESGQFEGGEAMEPKDDSEQKAQDKKNDEKVSLES